MNKETERENVIAIPCKLIKKKPTKTKHKLNSIIMGLFHSNFIEWVKCTLKRFHFIRHLVFYPSMAFASHCTSNVRYNWIFTIFTNRTCDGTLKCNVIDFDQIIPSNCTFCMDLSIEHWIDSICYARDR